MLPLLRHVFTKRIFAIFLFELFALICCFELLIQARITYWNDINKFPVTTFFFALTNTLLVQFALWSFGLYSREVIYSGRKLLFNLIGALLFCAALLLPTCACFNLTGIALFNFTLKFYLFALLGFIFIRNLIDFPVYYAAGQSLVSGRSDLYAPDFALGRVMDYRYPPFFILALYPLWLLPYPAAAYLWYILSIIEIAASVFFLRRLLDPPRSAWLIALFATGQYFVMILHYGNAHLPAIFLLLASFYLFARKKDPLAALMMALSITIKLTPVLLMPYFAIKRRWKFLALTAVFLVGLNIAPSAITIRKRDDAAGAPD